MLHRIRKMLKEKARQMLKGTVEVDETYVAGKNKNRHANKKVKNSQGRSAKDKTPVVGLLERNGKVYTYVVGDTTSQTIQPIMVNQLEKGARIISDFYRSYRGLEQIYSHITVKHNDSYITHQHNIGLLEPFKAWSSRYHLVSAKHLHRYCGEFSYRYKKG